MVLNAFLMFFIPLQNVDNFQQKCLRMDEKCFSTRWQRFPTFDSNAAVVTKPKLIVNTTNRALLTSKKLFRTSKLSERCI